MNSDINDIRCEKDFKGMTFSGFKLTEVKNILLNSLEGCKIEESCYWSAELVCSGHIKYFIDIVIYYYAKFIHTANPKMANYLDMRIHSIIEIMISYASLELSARNNKKMRKLVCEIVATLCNAKKRYIIADVKIPISSYDLSAIRDKMKAPNVNYLQSVFDQEEDPKEIFIPINELCFQLSKDGGDTATACYWVEWVIEWEKRCRKKHIKISCCRRSWTSKLIQTQHQKDIIWVLWDCVLSEISTREVPLLTRICNSLLYLYSVRYSNSVYSKRKYLLYSAITLLHLPTTVLNEPLFTEPTKEIVEIVTNKIDEIYKQIKSNEQSPNTDYLFSGLNKRNNLEKSLKQIDLVNSLLSSSGPPIIENDDTEECKDALEDDENI